MPDQALQSLLKDLLADLHEPQVVWQILALVLILLLSFFLARWLDRRQSDGAQGAVPKDEAGRIQHARALFPLLAGTTMYLAANIARHWHRHANLVHMVAILALALGVIRLAVYALRLVLRPSGSMVILQRSIELVVWAMVALHVTGLLPEVTRALDFPIYDGDPGSAAITLLQIIKGAFWVVVALMIAVWSGAALDSRLTKMAALDASLRVALSRSLRALLLIIAVLVSMQAVGIPLGVLSVFGGALGVGLGLGLQRIASNYVAGFIILLDRSLRIGDLITVDKYYGTVAQIRTRYSVIKSLDGTEAIIPNELLVSGAVVNHSYTSPQVRVAVRLTVAGDADVDKVSGFMIAAARSQARVLTDPAPTVLLTGFVADGLELELGFWVGDPENGSGLVKSEICRAVLADLRAAGINLPSPQRDLNVRGLDELLKRLAPPA